MRGVISRRVSVLDKDVFYCELRSNTKVQNVNSFSFSVSTTAALLSKTRVWGVKSPWSENSSFLPRLRRSRQFNDVFQLPN